MIPRTVLMAQEVAAQLSSNQVDEFGNVILNGYLSVVPNTINKKAWQYKETTTPPVDLPSLSAVQPALKGWTTNYMEYYTRLQPNGYGVNPGDPTMFSTWVNYFSQPTGAIATIGWISPGAGYTPGTYTGVALSGGSGTGATADIVVTVPVGVDYGPVGTVSAVSGGSGYSPNPAAFTGRGTRTITGNGSGLFVDGTSDNYVLLTLDSVSLGGQDYRVGDTFYVNPGTGIGRVDSVTPSGSVSSFTIVNPGTGYKVNEAVTALSLPGGSGFYAPIATIIPTPGTGGEPYWAQAPRRFYQNEVAPFVPPGNNPKAIPYSFIYPVPNNPVEPPIDNL